MQSETVQAAEYPPSTLQYQPGGQNYNRNYPHQFLCPHDKWKHILILSDRLIYFSEFLLNISHRFVVFGTDISTSHVFFFSVYEHNVWSIVVSVLPDVTIW